MRMNIVDRFALSGLGKKSSTQMALDLAIITVIWCVSIGIVDPIGDFPLENDWSFGRSVARLLETGDYRPLGWGAMTLVTNVLWGAIFCLPTGFSFTTLRFSSLIASLLALFGLFAIARHMNQPRWVAMLVTMTLAFNPLFHQVSYTFQTDALFVALSVWAILFLDQSRRNQSYMHELVGTILCVAATLSRQVALCIPLAFLLISVADKTNRTTLRILRYSVPFIVCSVILVVFIAWLKASDREPAYFGANSGHGRFIAETLPHVSVFIVHQARQIFVAFLYAGLFVLPISVICIWNAYLSNSKTTARFLALGGLITLLGVAIYSFGERNFLMPLGWPNLVKSGVGPLSLRDTAVLQLDHVPSFPDGFWATITIGTVVGAVLLLALVLRLFHSALTKRREADGCATLIILTAGIYLVVSSAALFHDRWVIPLVAFFAVAVPASASSFSVSHTRRFGAVGIVLIVFFALFSIGTTRDYLEWNRLRWEALRSLMRDYHVKPEEIDGGFEFNGLYLYDDNPHWLHGGDKTPWLVEGAEYLISFGPVDGYRTLQEYSYYNWLPPHAQVVSVLKKE